VNSDDGRIFSIKTTLIGSASLRLPGEIPDKEPEMRFAEWPNRTVMAPIKL
jgi:hypothetical protein